VAVIVLAIVVLPGYLGLTLLGHVIGLTPSLHELSLSSGWISAHYPDLVLRYLLTADLVIAIAFVLAGLFASDRPAIVAAPAAEPSLAVPEERRWVEVIRSTCPACGNADERPGGVARCPQCGTTIPDDARAATGRAVLER